MATVTFDHVTKRYGDVIAVRELSLEIRDAEFMVLVGPSGCGKTTSLRMIAGLEEISDGTLRIGDRVVNDVAAKDRDIAMVFQSYALYPHMTVRDNMAFGLKLRKLPKDDIEKRVKAAADTLGLENLLNRKPKELSGGQRQRVALGRAIVREPSVFLMDEPLSNLDAKLRVQTRAEIARLHQRLQTTVVYVTHDQVEAMTMGNRIAVMNAGDLLQVGTPQELYEHPRNRFVAGFIGSPSMNFVTLNVEGDRMKGSGFDFPIAGRFKDAVAKASSKEIIAGFRPEHLQFAGGGASGLPIRAKADVVEYLGNEELLHLSVAGHDADVIAVVGASRQVKSGDTLDLEVPEDNVHLFDSGSGDALLATDAVAA